MESFDLRLWAGFLDAGGDASNPAFIDQITLDSRRIDSTNSLFVALKGKLQDGHAFIFDAIKNGARFILAKKSWIPQDSLGHAIVLSVDDPLRAFQQIAATYRRQMPCKVIAIAGSYGKTMVKDLLQQMLKTKYAVVASPESFNSQTGVPLSLLTLRKEHEIALIEAAISEKNEMDALSSMIGADFGIITHIGKKHLVTLGNLDTVAGEILKILKFLPNNPWAILPEDPHLMQHLERFKIDFHFWTKPSPFLPHATFISKERAAPMPYQVHFPDGNYCFGEINSGFYYFLDLINITVKAAWLLGSSSKAICHSLSHYKLEPMRTEIWKSPEGVVFINDTYCSDPQSVDTALKHLTQVSDKSRRVFMFGGMREKHQHMEMDYKRIGKAIHQANIHELVLFGPHHFQSLIDEIRLLSPSIQISLYPAYKDALTHMHVHITQNDVVLIKGDKKYSIDQVTETFNDGICSNQCIINLAAIAENIRTIRNKLMNQTRLMVMVKALAYGTDEIRMAKFLETCGIDILGVSYVEEGISLRRSGISQSIFVINAAIYEAAKVVKWDLEIGISDKALIEAVASEASIQKKIIKVHLHVDTGMNRFGCRPEQALELAELIQTHPSLKLEGLMTHFACADDREHDAFTLSQVKCFENVIAELKSHGITPPWYHAANSSAVIRFDLSQFNMVRVGLAVYGLHSSQAAKETLELRLALSLISRIVGINVCQRGETISYGRSYLVQRESQKIAVLPIGYFDGLHRNYSGKGTVIVRGQKAPMVGKICMDFMMIDVTDIPNVTSGDPVLIFGEDEYGHYLSPEELASKGNSIIHELITCLGPRIQRIFVYEEAHRMRS